MTATKVGPGFVVSMVKRVMGELGARNLALVEWSATEFARLRGILGNLRHARDREEFERFMDEHRNQQGHPSGQ